MKAMVLCAGYGLRLGELTRQTPKPMLRLGDRPLLEHVLRHLVRHGFDEIALNLHFMPESIREYFGDGSRCGGRLVYSHEAELLGTAGGVKKMAGFLARSGDFLVHYGDVLTSQDFTAMLRFHREQQALATLLVHRRRRSNSVVVLDEDRRVAGFLERPTEEERLAVQSSWVFSGVTICAPELLDSVPSTAPCDLPRDVFGGLVATRRLFGFPLTGYRCAVDSPKRLAEARIAAERGFFE
jgi:mannose-1-phosphate guanylyltransferase/phosphomannomutase